jgi:hypothetical protein
MSDVYALLDYLSGRAWPSLAIPEYRRHGDPAARSASGTSVSTAPDGSLPERERIETDLEHPTALIQRAMQIGKSISNGNVSADDAAFLVSARDLLNVRAAPVTGSSITFTLLVVSKIHPQAASASLRAHLIRANEHLEPAASKLASFVRWSLCMMLVLVVTTLLLSAYVAWGKLLLDTRDAVLRDLGANEAVLGAQLVHANLGLSPPNDLVTAVCESDHRPFVIEQACNQNREVRQRLHDVVAHIQSWDVFPDEPEQGSVQHVAITVGVLGNYLLPVLYGALGAMGSMLRQFNRRLAERLLTPRDRRAAHIRVILGIVTGACIGLFFNSSAGPAQATGIGGAAVTLSASALAFLAGYGVEAVFRLMDAIISHLFRWDNGTANDVGAPHQIAQRNA